MGAITTDLGQVNAQLVSHSDAIVLEDLRWNIVHRRAFHSGTAHSLDLADKIFEAIRPRRPWRQELGEIEHVPATVVFRGSLVQSHAKTPGPLSEPVVMQQEMIPR